MLITSFFISKYYDLIIWYETARLHLSPTFLEKTKNKVDYLTCNCNILLLYKSAMYSSFSDKMNDSSTFSEMPRLGNQPTSRVDNEQQYILLSLMLHDHEHYYHDISAEVLPAIFR